MPTCQSNGHLARGHSDCVANLLGRGSRSPEPLIVGGAARGMANAPGRSSQTCKQSLLAGGNVVFPTLAARLERHIADINAAFPQHSDKDRALTCSAVCLSLPRVSGPI